MRRTIGVLLVAGLLLPAAALAADKESREKKDESQQGYQRKSMTYLGISGRSVDAGQLKTIERKVRPLLEMKRFDYNKVSLGDRMSMDTFVQAIRDYVQAVKLDRAKADGEFSERFKEINVTLADVERIADSAFFYQLRVPRLKFQKKTRRETWRFIVPPTGAVTLTPAQKVSEKKAPPKGMTKITLSVTREFWEAQLVTEADFYHVEMADTAGKGYKKIRTISAAVDNDAERPLVIEVVMKGGAVKLDKHRHTEDAAKTKARAFRGLNWLLLGKALQKQERDIPAFKLKVAVESADWNGVYFPLGKREGLWKDIGFYVNEFSTTGKKSRIGYVKVRDIGDNTRTPPKSSWAQTIYSDHEWAFEGGELLTEYPQIGYNIVLGVGVSSLYTGSMTSTQTTDTAQTASEAGIFGGGDFGMGISVHLSGEWNLAEYIGISEFYQTLHLEGDIYGDMVAGFVGLGILWKHYIHRLALGLEVYGLYGRLSGDFDLEGDGTSDVSVAFDDEDNHNGGVGGRLVVEIFITPDWTLAMRLGGRYVGSLSAGIPADLLTGPVGHVGIAYTF